MRILQLVVTAACLAAALWLLVLLLRDRLPGRPLLNLMAGIEALLLVHLVVGIVRVAGGAPDGTPVAEYVGYLLGLVLIVPAGVVWSSGERSRGATGVLLVATLVVPFMFVRLADLWPGVG